MNKTQAFLSLEPQEQVVTFAGGCFWDIQHQFHQLSGVVDTRAGFANVIKPILPDAEAVQVKFDTSQVDFKTLLDAFWSFHDPTYVQMQKTLYRSGIFTHSVDQLHEARHAKKIQTNHKEILTEIEPLGIFYPAIESHQRYREKQNRIR